MRRRLQAYYAAAFPDRKRVRVRDLARLNAGWESDVYAFAAHYELAGQRRREELILRIYPGNDAHYKSAREFHGMSQLYQAGYPVPQVLLLEREDSPFGMPFVIMERIHGQDMWPLLFGSSGEDQQQLLTQFCHLLARLHSLDWRLFARDVADDNAPHAPPLVHRELDKWRPVLERFPLPGFSPLIEWLEARQDQVPSHRLTPIHWDFHPANVLVRDDGSAVVIDWTQFDVSDPRFDLAWTLLLVGSIEGAAWRERILREYERLAGISVEQLEFFDVAACCRRLFSVVLSISHGADKLGMRPGAEAAMKRHLRPLTRVYDLLLDRTGIQVPEVEALFASLPGANHT